MNGLALLFAVIVGVMVGILILIILFLMFLSRPAKKTPPDPTPPSGSE